jgi:carbon storage regulator
MLVLSRKPGEQIRIGDEITLSVVRIQGNRVQLGIVAPSDIPVRREEALHHNRARTSEAGISNLYLTPDGTR